MSQATAPVGFSALGRAIDPKYRSNVLAVGAAAATGLLFGIYNGVAAEPFASSWVSASVGVFLAWAIGRELDPDNNWSAALAMAVALVFAVVAAPSLLFGLGLLIAVRLSTGSPGVSVKSLDVLALVVIGALLGTAAIPFAALPGLAIGVFIAEEGSKRGAMIAALVILSGIIAAVVTGPWFIDRAFGIGSMALALLVVVAATMSVPAVAPVSTPDVGSQPLAGWRLTVARVIAAATVLAAGIMASGSGIGAAFGTGGAALVVVALVKVIPQLDATTWPLGEREG